MSIIELITRNFHGLNPAEFSLLIIGALFTGGVGLMSFTFFVDDYWSDEEYRKSLQKGNRKKAL